MLSTLAVSDRAMATSGDYLQYFDYRGTRYHHLLDPETAAPRRGKTHSVTVSADRCMTADAAATTAFGVGRHAGERIVLARAPDARIERWV
jgi:thiamine biosynthesis lipoprotein